MQFIAHCAIQCTPLCNFAALSAKHLHHQERSCFTLLTLRCFLLACFQARLYNKRSNSRLSWLKGTDFTAAVSFLSRLPSIKSKARKIRVFLQLSPPPPIAIQKTKCRYINFGLLILFGASRWSVIWSGLPTASVLGIPFRCIEIGSLTKWSNSNYASSQPGLRLSSGEDMWTH